MEKGRVPTRIALFPGMTQRSFQGLAEGRTRRKVEGGLGCMTLRLEDRLQRLSKLAGRQRRLTVDRGIPRTAGWQGCRSTVIVIGTAGTGVGSTLRGTTTVGTAGINFGQHGR